MDGTAKDKHTAQRQNHMSDCTHHNHTFPNTYLLMRLSISTADSVSVISSPFFNGSPEPPGLQADVLIANKPAGFDRGDDVIRKMHIIP